jgi:hypothetical protein
MLAAKDVQRQIAVMTIVAMEEAPLLLPMYRIISAIEIEHNALGNLHITVQKEIHKQSLDRFRTMLDLVVAAVVRGALQSI